MLTAAEASARLLAPVGATVGVPTPLVDAHGLVLAADAIATVTLPPWPNAAMDGYAVRAADVMAASAATHGADWPEWRGTGRQGVWAETGIVERIPADGLKVG